MEADERRIKEGNDCIHKAKEHLKTSLLKLKTKPDYDSAAYEYERAAVCFRNASRLDLCRDAYLEAAKCYNGTKNLFHEAKAKESAAMAAKDAKDFETAERLFSESVDGYIAAGILATAAQTLDKAAKILAPTMPEKAAALYEKGVKYVHQDDTARAVIGFHERLIGLYLKLDRLSDARRTSRDLIEKFCELGEYNKVGKVVLGMALIELKLGDSIAALKCLEQMPASIVGMFGGDINALHRLVKAYEECDEDGFQQCLRESVWKAMDNDFLRLMKTLKAPNESQGITGQVATGGGGPATTIDEDEDGIC